MYQHCLTFEILHIHKTTHMQKKKKGGKESMSEVICMVSKSGINRQKCPGVMHFTQHTHTAAG